MTDEKEEVKEKTKCTKCGSTMTYIRFNSGERVCRTCGYTEKINLEEK